jgi:diadenylate cyclase
VTEVSGRVLGVFTQANTILDTIQKAHQRYALVDIILVGFLFYFFYLFLRQTRALRILYGLLILGALWVIGQVLELTLLNTILKWAFTSILVAIPVVFQPELRSALEKLGRTTNFVTDFNRLSKNEIDDIVSEILKAVAVLSKNKIGALIVISRSSGLKEWIDNGQALYANLNHRLLINIFTPKAPLHDGAVIISGHKIISAASTLPIVEDVVDLTLGTRHKAALSLSLQTDAIGLIVSEETGVVSLAVDGRLQRNLNMDDLKARIIKLLNHNKTKFRK